MEAENSIKRKKRKTRKCLDEIRNRSRGINLKASINNNTDTRFNHNQKKSILNEPKSSSNITTSRLTLAMFPKAVRSETITRPILTEIKNVNIFNEKKSASEATGMKRLIMSDKGESDENKHDDVHEPPSSAAGNVHNISISSASSSEPLILLDNKSETEQTEESKSVHSIATLSSASSQSPRVTYQNDFYEQLMNEIPFYLKKYTPNLIGRDPMKSNIAFIRKCHAETCQTECDVNATPSINIRKLTNGNPETVHETIVQNPKDYIRLAWQNGAIINLPHPSSIVPFPGSPASPQSPGDSPPTSTPLPLATPSIINDTPEYTYYPHRLN